MQLIYRKLLALLATIFVAACAPQSPPAPGTAQVGPAGAGIVRQSVAATDTAASGSVPGTTARDAIAAAAATLGGAERIASIRNITLLGYAHHAYQQGGGNITALPDAPQKYIAANDLRRIYDLENDRYYEQERRNDLFPFATYRGHSFDLQRRVLDGDAAYRVNSDTEASRVDDARELRMWMHTNPVVALRAAMQSQDSVSNRREEGGLTLVDVRLETGDVLTMAIRPPMNEPAWIRWRMGNNNLGEIELTTHFTGFVPYDGVRLPLGYNTKLGWRNVELLKLWVDGYIIDNETPEIAAVSAALASATDARAGSPEEIRALRPGIWRIGPTIVIEFSDHLTLFEAYGNNDRVRNAVALANTIVPSKRATRLVQSHHHFDHTGGLRQAVAEGLTIVTRRNNCVIFKEMTSQPAGNFPDDLERSGKALDCVPVDDSMILEDNTMRIELYHTINNNHTADNLFGYIPQYKTIIEADIASAAADLQWWGDSWIDNVEYRDLDVELNVPIHDNGGLGIWTYDYTLEFIAPGIERVKEWCARYEAAENYFAGCPAFVR